MLSVAAFMLRLMRVFGTVPMTMLMRSIGSDTAQIIVSVIEIAFAMVIVVYSIRVYSGLIEVYRVKNAGCGSGSSWNGLPP